MRRTMALLWAIILAAAVGLLSSCGVSNNTAANSSLNAPMARSSASISHTTSIVVADANNNRVLIYGEPATTDESASVILGQADAVTGTPNTGGVSGSTLFDPLGFAEDSNGQLIVADSANSRVLLFQPPLATGMAAGTALGQTSAGTTPVYPGVAAATANSLDFPTGVITDANGNIWVVDNDDSRVLEYVPTNGSFTSGQSAAVVIGQATLASTGLGATYDCNQASGGQALSATASTLCYPATAAFDSHGNLWVADGNNRVLEYVPPFTTGMSASLVIGEPDFVTAAGGSTASTLYAPWAVVFDSSGNLWVSDPGNNRVMEYAPPFRTGMDASLVLGQPDFATTSSGTTTNTFNEPMGLAFDSAGRLAVADSNNNRTLIFSPPFSTGMAADDGLGQASPDTGLPNQGWGAPTADSENTPYGVLAYQ